MSCDDKRKQFAEQTKIKSSRKIDVCDVWKRVKDKSQERSTELVPDTSNGWKTIRIFVSSTFPDFHQERDLLVQEVCIFNFTMNYIRPTNIYYIIGS